MIEKMNGTWVKVDSFDHLEIDDIWRRVEEKSGMDSLEIYFERWLPDAPIFQPDRVYVSADGKHAMFGAELNTLKLSSEEGKTWEPLYRHHEHHTARRSVEEANAIAEHAEKKLHELQTVPQGGETVAVLALNAEQRDNLLALLAAIYEERVKGLKSGSWIAEVVFNLGYRANTTDWGTPRLSPEELAVAHDYYYGVENQ